MNPTQLTETDIALALIEMLEHGADPDDTDMGEVECRTFDEAGKMTRNEGVVIQLADGSEFSLIIVQSHRPR
jgi:hypothetical protein